MIFPGPWYRLFDFPKDVVFPELLVLSNIFRFPAVNWAPKMDQKYKMWLRSILIKIQTSEGFFRVLLEDYHWSKFQQNRTKFWGSKPKKP